VTPGARVRVRMADTTGGKSITGTVVRIREGTLDLDQDRSVALGDVKTLEVSQGRRRLWREGAVLGAAVGAAVGLWACESHLVITTDPPMTFSSFDSTCFVGSVAFHGAVLGLGGLLIKKEEWGEVSLQPGGVPGVGGSVRFAWE
jgi:hypothetical protein